MSDPSPEQPAPDVTGTPSKAHGDPLLASAEGRNDGDDGSRQGPLPPRTRSRDRGLRVRGIVRPCRAHLGPELSARWQAHLCGLCLTLRDVAGQPERALTGYDVLLLSVLVEAQAGTVETTQAGPCPLRGFRPATVVASSSGAGRLAAAGALLSSAAGLADKIDDDDLPRAARRPAGRVAGRLARTGTALAAEVGLDPAPVLDAPAAATAVEQRPRPGSTTCSPRPGRRWRSCSRRPPSSPACPATSRPCVRAATRSAGSCTCSTPCRTSPPTRPRVASTRWPPPAPPPSPPGRWPTASSRTCARPWASAELVDPALVEVLLGRELVAAVHRALPVAAPVRADAVPAQRRGGTGSFAAAVALWSLAAPAVFVGGWSSRGGGCGPRRRPRGRRRYDPYRPAYGPSYGTRSVGPSCGQLLACNCCANVACNSCCCGSDCGDV